MSWGEGRGGPGGAGPPRRASTVGLKLGWTQFHQDANIMVMIMALYHLMTMSPQWWLWLWNSPSLTMLALPGEQRRPLARSGHLSISFHLKFYLIWFDFDLWSIWFDLIWFKATSPSPSVSESVQLLWFDHLKKVWPLRYKLDSPACQSLCMYPPVSARKVGGR